MRRATVERLRRLESNGRGLRPRAPAYVSYLFCARRDRAENGSAPQGEPALAHERRGGVSRYRAENGSAPQGDPSLAPNPWPLKGAAASAATAPVLFPTGK